ncbi:MAG: TPM domain-containing protein [Sphingomonadales bacterium]
MKLTREDQDRIEAAVAAAEKRTGAEFALAVAQAADRYAAWPALWAALLALVTGGTAALTLPDLHARALFGIEAAVLVVAGLILHAAPIRPLLAPRWVRREEAAKLARLQFSALVQRRTSGRVGVLLFVSLAEHHIEIIVDRAIDERIPARSWQGVVEAFAARIRRGELADGFIEAVDRCAGLLERQFPVLPDDRDELPNRVTLI